MTSSETEIEFIYSMSYRGGPYGPSTASFRVGDMIYTYTIPSPFFFDKIRSIAGVSRNRALNYTKKIASSFIKKLLGEPIEQGRF